MAFVVNIAKGFVDAGVDLVTGAVDIIVDIVDFAVDEIIQPVVQGAGDIIQAALDDPITTIAKVAAFATGNAWAIPMIDGASVAANGGDIGDIIKATAISYAGSKVGSTVSTFVDPQLAKAGFNSTVTAAISGGTKSAATALIYGQDPLQAFATGGLNAGVGALLGDIDTKLTNAVEGQFDEFNKPVVSGWENLQDGVKDSITASLAAELDGGSISADALGGIVSRYTGVAKTMEKFLTDNTGVDAGQAALLTSALNSAAVTALAGNPELSGEAFFAKFDEYGMAELKAIVDKPVNKTIDKLTGAFGTTETAATALNEVMTKTADAADGFNGLRTELNGKIQEQDRLEGVFTAAETAYKANPSQATADAQNDAASAFNAYANQLKADYDNTYKPQMDAFQATYDEFNPQIEELQGEYDNELKYLMSDIDDLSSEMKPVFSDTERAVALALRPGLDEDAYRETYGLTADVDVYEHFLSQGQNGPASGPEIKTTLDAVRLATVQSALSSKGITLESLKPEQLAAYLAYANKEITSIASITGLDTDKFANTMVADAEDSQGAAALKPVMFGIDVEVNDLLTGNAVLINDDGELYWKLKEQQQEALGTDTDVNSVVNTANANIEVVDHRLLTEFLLGFPLLVLTN